MSDLASSCDSKNLARTWHACIVSMFIYTDLASAVMMHRFGVLAMQGPAVTKQLGGTDTVGALSKGTGRFVLGNANTKLVTDGRLACLVTNHFLRAGLAEMASEMVQLSMPHHMTRLCT
jgi:hypothetical protein